MKIRVWGARGSVPTPLDSEAIEEKICRAIYGMSNVNTGDMEAIRAYVAKLPPLVRGTIGGNTSCVEIEAGGQTFIIDAGTGLRRLGLELMKGPCGRGEGVLHFFFSHAHWDHIQGFPFFTPAYIPGNRLVIYSIHNLEEILTTQQRAQNFPVPLSYMQAEIEFVPLEVGVPFSVGPLSINTIRNNHPGDSYSYRFEDQHSIFVYANDAEYKELDEASLQAHLEFFKDADALVFDAQYGLRESWESKLDWGHSSAMIGVDMARKARVKRLLLFHHEPTYADNQLQEIQSTAIDYQAQDSSLSTCEVMVAYEGLELDLTPAGAISVQLMPDSETTVLTPTSVFDEQGVGQLIEQLGTAATPEVPKGSIIDLSQVERLTTASLKALVNFSQQREEGPVVLAAPSPAVEQVIRLGGYRDYFAIYYSIDEAVKAVKARQALDLPGHIIDGQYQLTEKLGQGRFGTVLQVTDLHQKEEAAIRILSPTFGVEAVDHFAGQVHLLLELKHHNIAQIYDCDWSQDGSYTFIVEELLAGSTLYERLAGLNAPLAISEALDITLDLAQALEYAHNQGVIHGNLKPQDIFFTQAGIKINGFGLARLEENRNLLEAPIVFSTATYLAPEQILGQPLDTQVDLYALGIILYQLFTGHLPFTGSRRQLLRAHLEQELTPPRQLNSHLPHSIEHLILKLLAKNPNNRYASARQVRRIVDNLIFSGGDGRQTAQSFLVGRDSQLQTLQACWAKVEAGQGQMAFITGEAGIGKTCLAQQLAAHSQAALVLWGRCSEGESRSIFQPFREALQSYIAAAPPGFFDDNSLRLMSSFIRLMPELSHLFSDLPALPALEPPQEQLRLMANLAQFIERATRQQPWLLILDDLQWIDQGSLELLRYLGERLSQLAIFIAGIYRDTDVGHDHPLQTALHHLSQVPGYRHVSLSRLSQAEVTTFLENRWDSNAPENLTQIIFRQTEGNPLFVTEIARVLEDEGLVTLQAGQWEFPQAESISLPQSVSQAVDGRISHLSADTRNALSQAAVLGQIFRLDDLVGMSALSQWEVLEHLDLALERQLVQEINSNIFGFNHKKIQEVIYNKLGVLRRRRLHHRAGETLEQREHPQPKQLAETLAYHFGEAGELKKALEYSLYAARRARAVYLNELALRRYQKAINLFEKLQPQDSPEFAAWGQTLYQERDELLALANNPHHPTQPDSQQ